MHLICSHSNAFIRTMAKYSMHKEIFHLQSFEVVFNFLHKKFQLKVVED